MAKANRVYHYKVKGFGTFPIDMLRYDGAYPATEVDSGLIARTMRRPERITVNDRLVDRANVEPIELVSHFPPTEGRWESFLWKVVPGSVEVRS